MKAQHNRHNQMFKLTERGYRQAQRNNSHQLWTLLSWAQGSQEGHSLDKQIQTTLQSTLPKIIETVHLDEVKRSTNDASPSLQKNQEELQQKFQLKDLNTNSEIVRKNNSVKSEGSKMKKENFQSAIESEPCSLKIKFIEKYLRQRKPFTRTMSNSAFRKFYQRPCLETYGRAATNGEEVFYGNFMKTHNIQPHTLDNKPEHVQAYTTALNFAKRTKLDPQDRWKRMQRQLSKNINLRVPDVNDFEKRQNKAGRGKKEPKNEADSLKRPVNSSLKMTNCTSQQGRKWNRSDNKMAFQDKIRSKSAEKPLCYIYRYKQSAEDDEGNDRYARDRHGITCYIDMTFRENEEAYRQFQNKVRPLSPQKCRAEDRNIDRCRVQNNVKAKEEGFPCHYLTPVVDAPYIPSKYSRRKQSSQDRVVL